MDFVPTYDIRPSPENDDIYNHVDIDRADYRATLDSIRENGIREALQVTADDYILSGHRRHRCAVELALEVVPIVRLPIRRSETPTSEYRRLLAEYNTQRDKTPGERVRELAARAEPKAFRQIIAERSETRTGAGQLIQTCGEIARSQIGPNAKEFLDSVIEIVSNEYENWPISVRSVHYKLLDVQPLTNSSTGSQRHRYANDQKSSSKLSDLLTRARVFGIIPMGAIADETRSETIWAVDDSVADYVGRLADDFANGYRRNLMTDQPNHIEIIVEKNTVKAMTNRVAAEYTIPVTVARGKCSLPPRAHVVDRWKRSGKDKLVLILLADHDPDGIVISEMWHKSLIGDFGIAPGDLIAIRAGLNKDQIERFDLPKSISAKPSSPTYQAFVREHGSDAFELDALSGADFENVLREAIEGVIDRTAFDSQVEIYEQEAGMLEVMREEFTEFVGGLMDRNLN